MIAFVDNEAAVSTIIRGSSSTVDCTHLAELLHAILLKLSARIWVEWIDSDSNPADGLSRAGLNDHWQKCKDTALYVWWHISPLACTDIFLGQTL